MCQICTDHPAEFITGPDSEFDPGLWICAYCAGGRKT